MRAQSASVTEMGKRGGGLGPPFFVAGRPTYWVGQSTKTVHLLRRRQRDASHRIGSCSLIGVSVTPSHRSATASKKAGESSLAFLCPSALPSLQGILPLPVWIQHIGIASHHGYFGCICSCCKDPSRLRCSPVLHPHQHTHGTGIPQDVQACSSIGAAPLPRSMPHRPIHTQQLSPLSWQLVRFAWINRQILIIANLLGYVSQTFTSPKQKCTNGRTPLHGRGHWQEAAHVEK